MILPNSGMSSGTYQIAIFGLNFVPSSHLVIQFGPHVVCQDIEYHCSTAVIATIHVNGVEPGNVVVTASNDGGRHFGPSQVFRFYGNVTIKTNLTLIIDTEERVQPNLGYTENLTLIQSQLTNVRRSITQLQSGIINVQQLETELRSKVEKASTLKLDQIEHITFEGNAQTFSVTPNYFKTKKTMKMLFKLKMSLRML